MRDRIDISKFYGSVCQKTESPLCISFWGFCACQCYDVGFDFPGNFRLYRRSIPFLAVQSGIETFFSIAGPDIIECPFGLFLISYLFYWSKMSYFDCLLLYSGTISFIFLTISISSPVNDN